MGDTPPLGTTTHTLLLGAASAQPRGWATRLQPLAPLGTTLTACEWGQAGWWTVFTQAPRPAPWTCLLLLHLGGSHPTAQPSDRWAEDQARTWLAQNKHNHRLFYLDLLPGEDLAATQSRLLRALGYTPLVHPNNHAVWSCNGCSDPDCERRLFSPLVGGGPPPRSLNGG